MARHIPFKGFERLNWLLIKHRFNQYIDAIGFIFITLSAFAN